MAAKRREASSSSSADAAGNASGDSASGGRQGSASISAMGSVVPDREHFRRDLLAVLPARISLQASSSASQPDGVAQAASLVLPLLTPSGVSRPQFLVAAQAASLPFFPAYAESQGGVVLDRVLGTLGGDSWWATLTGRMRAQRVLAHRRTRGWRQALQDPASYALACHSSARLQDGALLIRGRLTYDALLQPPSPARPTLPAVAEADDASAATHQQHRSGASSWREQLRTHGRRTSGAALLRRKLGSSSELRAEVGAQVPVAHLPGGVDGAARGSGVQLPFLASVDVCTAPNVARALQYRVGLQHAVAPSAGSAGGGGGGGANTHLRAGLALQGQRTLWQGKVMAHRRAAAASSATAQARGQGKGRGRGKQILPGATHAQSAAQPLAPAHATGDAVPGSQGAAAGADAAQQQQRPRSKVLGPHNPIRQVLQRLLKPPSTSSSSSSSSNGNAPAGSAAAASPDGDASASSLGTASTAGGAGARTWSKRSAVVGDVVVPLPEPGEVQEAVLDTTQSIKRLREDVQNLVEWVSSGGLTEQLQRATANLEAAAPGKKARAPAPSKQRAPSSHAKAAPGPSSSSGAAPPWSALVGAPHLKLGALVGLHMWQPLVQLRPHAPHGPGAPSFARRSGTAPPTPLARASQQQQQQQPASLSEGGAPGPGALARANSLSVDLVRSGVAWLMSAWREAAAAADDGGVAAAPGGGAARWGPQARGGLPASLLGPNSSGAHLFASLGASAQLGWFQKRALDWTRVSARLDIGGPGPSMWLPSGKALPPQPVWTTAVLSVGQQLVGPLRLFADLRYGLTLPAAPAAEGTAQVEPGTGKGKVAAVRDRAVRAIGGQASRLRGTRPHLLDSAVGLDVVVPGTGGFARVLAWWAPQRGEAMLELRML